MHIGHVKAVLVNQYYQQRYKGKLIMRFDDTNPAKENKEFEEAILEDLEILQVKYDLTRTSNYFQKIVEYCEKMLSEGKAYVDDTDPKKMKVDRKEKIISIRRSNSEWIYFIFNFLFFQI